VRGVAARNSQSTVIYARFFPSSPQHDAALQGAAHNNPVANDAVMSSPAAIPAVQDEAAAEAPDGTNDGTKRPGEVLVVDDMGTVRLMLTRHIVQMGHRVTPAKHGRERWNCSVRNRSIWCCSILKCPK
jgi:PleD family two-component response regulator